MTYTVDSSLLSLGQAAAYAIQAWVTRHNAQAPSDFGSTLVSQCSQAGLNADLCAAQVMHETGWLTSDWFVNHWNPAGVGVTGQPGVGITFPTMEAGIRGYLAHLLTYIEGASNPWKADDPRYQAAMSAGVAGMVKTVGGLAGTWAVPGTGYGQALVSLANDLVASIGGGMAAADDSKAQWLASSNFDQGRNGKQIQFIILHTTEGGYSGSVNWLRGAAGGSSNRGSSSHYVVSADGAQVAQLVREADTAWAAGNLLYNQQAINIEQEGYAAKGGFSDSLYQATGSLVGRIASRHGIPLDRAHVIGHMDVPDPNNPALKGGVDHHTDPGPLYDFATVIAIAQGQQPAPLVPATPATDTRYFPETQHHLSHGFKAYWEHFGGLPIFGFPISEEFDIGGLVVQYFEKGARFEWHPGSGGNPPNPWDVMEGNTGTEVLDSLKEKYPDAFKPVQP